MQSGERKHAPLRLALRCACDVAGREGKPQGEAQSCAGPGIPHSDQARAMRATNQAQGPPNPWS